MAVSKTDRSSNGSNAAADESQQAVMPWLRRSEQLVWLFGVLVLFGVTLASFYARRNREGRLIEINQAAPKEARFLVDINSADWAELTVLPGISETFARRIVQHRDQQVHFQTLAELKAVPGVGEKTFQRLRPYLVIGANSRSDSPLQ